MKGGISKLSMTFAAGCVGGLVAALMLYLCGALGLMESYGVKMKPALTLPWLYQHIVWGGLWGLLFGLPILDKVFWVGRGAAFSLIPACAQWFVFYPLISNDGLFGSRLGDNTPFFVLGFCLLWGLMTAWWLRMSRS